MQADRPRLLGGYSYSGSNAPDSWNGRSSGMKSFSVGNFQWVEAPHGENGVKRGDVLVRVKGPTAKPELVYKKVKEIVAALEAGAYFGPAGVRVGWPW